MPAVAQTVSAAPPERKGPSSLSAMRVIVADDHRLIREILGQYIESIAPGLEIIETGSLSGVLAAAGAEAIDLILLDIQMPGMDGPRGVAEVRQRFPESRIVVVSGRADHAAISEAIRYGADGYVPKASGGKLLLKALRFVLAGETYLPAHLLNFAPAAIESKVPPAAPEPEEGVTAREVEVLQLLITGKSNKEIGRDLELKEVTVKVHLRNIYRKLRAGNRAEAVRIAIVRGLTR